VSGANFVLGIPTLNAEKNLDAFLLGLEQQTQKPDRILVVDSSSDDHTVDRFREYGAEVSIIGRNEFDHGGTRQRIVDACGDDEIVVFMTQDAICADEYAFANLVAAVEDPQVGAACGRQLPHKNAGAVEAHARAFNYPDTSRRLSKADIDRLGIRAAFMSNSFAAYRIDALKEVGGFPIRTIMNEDMYVAARMLMSGRSVAYAGDARVHHSHSYNIGEEFRRYFDIGVFFAHNRWLVDRFGGAGGEGRKYLASELRWLLERQPTAIPGSIARNAMKLVGLELGRRHHLIPAGLKPRLSVQRTYWQTSRPIA
jgi:rhamnosyltransferase